MNKEDLELKTQKLIERQIELKTKIIFEAIEDHIKKSNNQLNYLQILDFCVYAQYFDLLAAFCMIDRDSEALLEFYDNIDIIKECFGEAKFIPGL